MIDNKKILITGGTGTFGQQAVSQLLKTNVKKIYIFSRDELKQHEMKLKYGNNDKISYLIGDIRDRDRLYRAFNGIDIVIHASALKQVPSCEYNPFEAIKTNIIGAQNVVDASIDMGVKCVIGLSTDKAVEPSNLYGATKLCQEKIFISGNSYVGNKDTKFSIVRYGNVLASRGSVFSIFKNCILNDEEIPITSEKMTRFFIIASDAVKFVIECLNVMIGGEIFIPRMPSMEIIDLAYGIAKYYNVYAPALNFETIGIREGEKIHETLISKSETKNLLKFKNKFIIKPTFEWLNFVPTYEEEFQMSNISDIPYTSGNNDEWIDSKKIMNYIERIENDDSL
jgi:UDP-N-acetylglucosamine 4,6-dehydratase